MIIYPPKDTEFRLCVLCDCPFVFDGKSNNCLWCEIHKDNPVNEGKEELM